MVDTDVLIWILRGDEKHRLEFEEILNQNQVIAITPIQYMEIMAGVRNKEKNKTELFLDALCLIEINIKMGQLAGEYLKKYQKSHRVHNADALIASAVKTVSAKLWTNNIKHYPMLRKNDFFT